MKVFGRLALCAVIMAIPACHQASRVTSPSPPATTDLVSGTGTLINTGECRAWHIQADSGRLYELTSLASEFQQQDLRVRFVLKTRIDVASFCMMGEMTDVVSMRRF